ncbi:hypothetical protein ACFE04_020137 [Oxalis oulophora]
MYKRRCICDGNDRQEGKHNISYCKKHKESIKDIKDQLATKKAQLRPKKDVLQRAIGKPPKYGRALTDGPIECRLKETLEREGMYVNKDPPVDQTACQVFNDTYPQNIYEARVVTFSKTLQLLIVTTIKVLASLVLNTTNATGSHVTNHPSPTAITQHIDGSIVIQFGGSILVYKLFKELESYPIAPQEND